VSAAGAEDATARAAAGGKGEGSGASGDMASGGGAEEDERIRAIEALTRASCPSQYGTHAHVPFKH
jgi:hypothetical protein